MAKRKTGLHKRITSIFDGVPIPEKTDAPAPDGADRVFPKAPPPPRPQASPKPQFQRTAQPSLKVAPSKQHKVAVSPKAKVPTGKTPRKRGESRFFKPKPGVSVKRQKIMVILIPVLSAILVFAIVRVFRMPLPKITEPTGIETTAVIAGSIKIDWKIPEPYPATLRDPMRFVSIRTAQATGGEEEGAGQIIVTGISYEEDEPLALIGTQIVREGDQVFGATVVKINRNSVEFEMGDKKWTQEVQSLQKVPKKK